MAIFINYRRQDSAAIAGRIDDHLRRAFDDSEVYRDIDSIPLGEDYVEHIGKALESCDICLAIIGPDWSPERLAASDDFVRVELEFVLQRKVPVIPILVDGAELPTPEQLPESLQPLRRRQAARVDSGNDFHAQLQRVVAHIKERRSKLQRERESVPNDKADLARASVASLQPSVVEPPAETPASAASLTHLTVPWFSGRRLAALGVLGLGGLIATIIVATRGTEPRPAPATSSDATAERAPTPPSASTQQNTPPPQSAPSGAAEPPPIASTALSKKAESKPVWAPSDLFPEPKQSSTNVANGEAKVGTATSDGAVSNAARVVAGLRPGFRNCYQRGLSEDPLAAGSLQLTIKIGAKGAVQNVDAAEKSGKLPASVVSCVEAIALAAQFAPPESGQAVLALPLTFVRSQ